MEFWTVKNLLTIGHITPKCAIAKVHDNDDDAAKPVRHAQRIWIYDLMVMAHYKQEAQLLLGDRATRKHAKDSWNGRGNDILGWMTFKCTSMSSNVAPIES